VGTASTTVSGRTCQAWSANTPHVVPQHFQSDDVYPDGSRAAARNYCRHPAYPIIAGVMGVWCYTTDPQVQWEICDVPLCSGKSTAVSSRMGTRRKSPRPRRDRDAHLPRPRRDRDVGFTSRDETETRRQNFETRPRRDVCSSRDVIETLKYDFY